MRIALCLIALVPAVSLCDLPALAESEGPLAARPHLRQPVALAFIDGRIYTANQRSGTISVVDPQRPQAVAEMPVGQRLSDLAAIRDARFLLAVDEAAHELVLIRRTGKTVSVVQRLAVPHTPVSIAVSPNGDRCFVSSLWARQLAVVDVLTTGSSPCLSIAATIDLPFAPRKQVFVPAGVASDKPRLIVADSFGGELAVIDPLGAELLWTRSIAGHNIRGLAVSHDGRELLLAHQILDGGTGTDYENVFWGGVMINVFRSVELADILSPQPQAENVSEIFGTHALGHPGSATGDPGDILVTRSGRTVVSLSGVGELAMRARPTAPFDRYEAGSRPTALVADAAEEIVYAANTFGDSISILNLRTMQTGDAIPLGPAPELSDADRGERLFYDAALSLNGWYSCHSCHTDGHTNGLLTDTLGDDYFGDPKRVPTLLGTAETGPWAWHGGVASLETQLRKSIRITMQGNLPRDEDVQALQAYLKQLTPPPSVAAARGNLDADAVQRGRRLFETQGCAGCHRPPAYTSAAVYDVGLHDRRGTTEFNPPSLRGLSQRGRYFHDNRARSLEDVLTKFGHGEAGELSAGERRDLLQFLKSL